MRSLSATLLAAQRVSPQRPRVRVLVRDKQARLTLLGRQSTADAQSAACTAGDNLTIVIASLDTAGRIRVRRVTDPSVLDPTADPGTGWGWYTADYAQVVAAGMAMAWPNGDVCISNNAGTLRVFYVNAAGTTIVALESTDNGVTWGPSAVTVRVVPGGTTGYVYKLASAGHNDIWYTIGRPGYRYINMGSYAGGAWGSFTNVQYLMETGGEYTTCRGLAVQWDAALSLYAVVAALDRAGNGDGRIVSAHWNHATTTISDYQGVVPPGLPTLGSGPTAPALLQTSGALGSLWVLTYWDTFSAGSTSWATPMCILSRDFSHWSFKIPLAFTATTNRKRVNVVELSKVVYLHDINEAYKLDLWYSGKAAMEITITQNAILRYRINERPEAGELHVELDNRGGTYDNAGRSSGSGGAEALKPLCQVIVEQGLNTAAGDERVECRPFYLWSTSQVRSAGVNLSRIHAVDGWQLLRLWRPDCTIQWENKTLRWCIAEIASRAGFWEVSTDGASQWDGVLTYLTVAASYNDWQERWYIRALGRSMAVDEPLVVFGAEMNGLTILQHLLNLVGGAARFGNGESREVLHCFIPSAQGESPVAAHTYNDGEVLALQSVEGFAWPTRVRVSGSAGGYEGQSVTHGLAVGMDFLQLLYASQWSTAAQLHDIAAGALDDASARASGGWLRIRPNAGLELYDVVTFSDLKAGAGLTSLKRRVNALLTEYEPLRGLWQQTAYLEGA